VDLALVTALFCVALLLRLVPLFVSPLPNNTEGFPLSKIAEQITASGEWRMNPTDVNREDLKVPGTSLVLSSVAQLASLDPLPHGQLIFSVLASTIVAPIYLIGVKGTGRRGIGLAAGVFGATYGSLLFLTSAVMKETLGLVLLPATILMVHERADPRKRGIAIVLLLVLPFVDYLTLFMAMGMAASVVFLSHARDLSQRQLSARRLGLDLVTLGGPLLVAWAYYDSVGLFYFTQATSAGALVALLAAGIVLLVLLVWRWKPTSASSIRRLVAPIVVVIVGVFLTAAVLFGPQLDLFAEMPEIRPELQAIVPAIVLLAVFAAVGYHVMRRAGGYLNDLAVSMLAAPVVLILFGFAIDRGRLSFRIVYRSIDYVDFAFAILAGIGLVLAIARLRRHRSVGVALGATFVVALILTTPMAYNTGAVFGVETGTTPQEFQALQTIASFAPKTMLSDSRLSSIASLWFGLRSNFRLPIWLEDGSPIRGYDYALVLERWTTVGATMFPGPTVVLDRATLDGFLAANHVIQVFGTPGDRIYIVRFSNAPPG
jgi:hypothetical protein